MIVEKMCLAISPIMNKIHAHPFNQELSQGILPKEKFIDYMQQDILYLREYSRALGFVSARLTCNVQAQYFMQFAIDAIKAEQALHLQYLNQHHAQLNVEPNPTCFTYINYLLRMASTSLVEEAVASLLPCFWVYREVGKIISDNSIENNQYATWINLYSSQEFNHSVQLAIEVTNNLAALATNSVQEKMQTAFIRSTQLEWYFWDAVYQQERWTIFKD